MRLALGIAQAEGIDEVDALFKAYASPVSDLIDDYNGSFYDPPQSILETYHSGLEMEREGEGWVAFPRLGETLGATVNFVRRLIPSSGAEGNLPNILCAERKCLYAYCS